MTNNATFSGVSNENIVSCVARSSCAFLETYLVKLTRIDLIGSTSKMKILFPEFTGRCWFYENATRSFLAFSLFLNFTLILLLFTNFLADFSVAVENCRFSLRLNSVAYNTRASEQQQASERRRAMQLER